VAMQIRRHSTFNCHNISCVIRAWLVGCLTSHSTHYRSFQGRLNQLVVEIRLESHQNHSTNRLYALRKGPNVTNPICWTCKNCSYECAVNCVIRAVSVLWQNLARSKLIHTYRQPKSNWLRPQHLAHVSFTMMRYISTFYLLIYF